MMAHRLRLAFFGTPDFAVPVLDGLMAAGHDVVRVYTQPPRPAGRGRKPSPSPVARRAQSHRLAIDTPSSWRDSQVLQMFGALGLDAAIVVAYGQILPIAVLDAPRMGCLNLHASLLPRWRGAAPIQRAIMAGDCRTGVCVMQMEAGLDTGPVLAQHAIDITPNDTAQSLHDTLAQKGAALMASTLADLAQGRLIAHPQPQTGITYAHKIDKSEARINWAHSAVDIDRQIRGLSPFPGAWDIFEGTRLKFLHSEVVQGAGKPGQPGQVLDDRLSIACGSGAVRILEIQRAGQRRLDATAFLRARPIPVGAVLGQ